MTDRVILYPTASRRIKAGGTAQVVMYGPLLGGTIANPSSPVDQGGIDPPESVFVDFSGVAPGLAASATTVELRPGESVNVPSMLAGNVMINAATTGHRFSGFVVQVPVPTPPLPPLGPFPPSGPTSLLDAIPSYLYWQYRDDEDLQASRDVYNAEAQLYVDWFNSIGLPIYTGLSGGLLDWVAEGLYGIKRPSLPAGIGVPVGPFDTYAINGVPFDFYDVVGDTEFFATTDDTFKRIVTWAFFKDDGKVFNVRWLKRRITRFLRGVDGINFNVDETYDVSVSFGPDNEVHVAVGTYAPLLKSAIDAGILELPFQYEFIVTTG